ncbi:hypothetical protein KAR91_42735 [Candidatus Pacearchaeota archaeon]|nr:hypothetical protein [Candidatus Pacearchaeota archaeon]
MSILTLHHFNELAGSIAYDSSGNDLNANVTGTTINTPGMLGAADRDYNGINEYSKVNSTSLLNLNEKDFSAVIWLNPVALGGFQRLFCMNGTTQINSFSMLLDGGKLGYQINNLGHANLSAGSFSNGAKQMAGFSFNNTTRNVRLYLDGVFDTQYYHDDTPLNGTTDLWIGSNASVNQPFEGPLDEAAIADELWDDAYFTYLWNGGIGREIEVEVGIQILRRRMEDY